MFCPILTGAVLPDTRGEPYFTAIKWLLVVLDMPPAANLGHFGTLLRAAVVLESHHRTELPQPLMMSQRQGGRPEGGRKGPEWSRKQSLLGAWQVYIEGNGAADILHASLALTCLFGTTQACAS